MKTLEVHAESVVCYREEVSDCEVSLAEEVIGERDQGNQGVSSRCYRISELNMQPLSLSLELRGWDGVADQKN